MVDKSVKPSAKDTLASRPMARNLKACGRKGVGYLAEDLSCISDAEVAGYLNTKKETLLMKMAWEMMNPDYKKGTQRKPTTVKKKKDPISKTAAPPSKKTSATPTQSNAESEKKKRLSSYINLDLLDTLFDDDEKTPKRTKLEKPVVIGDQVKKSQQSSEECLVEPEGSEEDEPVWNGNEDYSNEDANGGADEFYGDADLEYEDEGEDNEDIIW
ncbi:Zinc ion binding / transcription regulator [Hirschfeldia incana]|nr:Zinc ion binding / transcription regulator [Hirschfeldia incana]